VLRLPAVTSAPFTSRGHLPEQRVDVRVNGVARANYVALVTDSVFPDGSLLAELSHGTPGRGYVMRKNAGVWSYFELDPQGSVLAGGALTLCAGCHQQAPADHVFGLPRGSWKRRSVGIFPVSGAFWKEAHEMRVHFGESDPKWAKTRAKSPSSGLVPQELHAIS
jgi:hypothetical protein